MIASRRLTRPMPSPTHIPSSSGPRCRRTSSMRSSSPESIGALAKSKMPAIPHIRCLRLWYRAGEHRGAVNVVSEDARVDDAQARLSHQLRDILLFEEMEVVATTIGVEGIDQRSVSKPEPKLGGRASCWVHDQMSNCSGADAAQVAFDHPLPSANEARRSKRRGRGSTYGIGVDDAHPDRYPTQWLGHPLHLAQRDNRVNDVIERRCGDGDVERSRAKRQPLSDSHNELELAPAVSWQRVDADIAGGSISSEIRRPSVDAAADVEHDAAEV